MAIGWIRELILRGPEDRGCLGADYNPVVHKLCEPETFVNNNTYLQGCEDH